MCGRQHRSGARRISQTTSGPDAVTLRSGMSLYSVCTVCVSNEDENDYAILAMAKGYARDVRPPIRVNLFAQEAEARQRVGPRH